MSPPLISEKVREYLNGLVPDRPSEMQKMEAYATEHRFPIIGPAAGYTCYLIAKISQAKKIFEMGSGYGYSTAWFAKAVMENGGGSVHHVVWDKDLSEMARQHLEILGFDHIVQYTIGEAVQALRESEGGFDLIFNDINKSAYPESLDVIDQKLRPGGVLIVDNVLWSGRIFDPQDTEESTQAIRVLNERLAKSDAWVTSIFPIRDGLLVAQKQTA